MKNRLSPREELRAEMLRLQQEGRLQEARLKKQIVYARENWGSLILYSTLNSSKDMIGSLFMGSKNNEGYKGKPLLLDKLSMFAPLAWGIAQPILLGMLTRKLKSFFFKKKK